MTVVATEEYKHQIQRFEHLRKQISNYMDQEQIEQVSKAFKFSAAAHSGQLRKSGEPFIEHPLAVSRILADMRMDHETLIAAMLHDVIEDTRVAKAQIKRNFGSGVAQIVDGLSKLTQIEFDSYAEVQAKNFQKMLMAMASDIRVILVKLADRMHNMRTIQHLSLQKRKLIAKETLEIYAPIAHRLGINSIRLELEELGFSTLYPLRQAVLSRVISKIRGNRKEVIKKIGNRLKRNLRQEGLVAHVIGREKHLYSIYNKMKEKNLHFNEVRDVYAFRIIVDSVDTCYRTLGLIHGLYKPIPGAFKDYIALPKANGYQSLHTVLFGPFGVPIEIQIRTNEMDHMAEAGIAAHWSYKTGDRAKKNAKKLAHEWLRGVLEIQQKAGNSLEFLEHVKVDLFPDEVFILTPNGDVFKLPQGACSIDLAFAIHTDVGKRCVGCRINKRIAPLRTKLQNGDQIEIVTAPNATPNPMWLGYVVTARARANIRHYLKNQQRDEAIRLGMRMLENTFISGSTSIKDCQDQELTSILGKLNLTSLDDLYAEIGLGNKSPLLIAETLKNEIRKANPNSKEKAKQAEPLLIRGTEGMVISIPKCCYPIPGDQIMGVLTSGRGIVIHRPNCKNTNEYRKAPEQWVDVDWAKVVDKEFSSEIIIDVQNQRGVLATVAASCADREANIEEIDFSERDEYYMVMRLTISVKDRKHLADIIRGLRKIKTVVRVSRKL